MGPMGGAWTRAWRKERSGDACCTQLLLALFWVQLAGNGAHLVYNLPFARSRTPNWPSTFWRGGGAPVKEEVPVVENAQKWQVRSDAGVACPFALRPSLA